MSLLAAYYRLERRADLPPGHADGDETPTRSIFRFKSPKHFKHGRLLSISLHASAHFYHRPILIISEQNVGRLP